MPTNKGGGKKSMIWVIIIIILIIIIKMFKFTKPVVNSPVERPGHRQDSNTKFCFKKHERTVLPGLM
jgi:hypothetical protein